MESVEISVKIQAFLYILISDRSVFICHVSASLWDAFER